MKAIICVGPPASGKSKWTREFMELDDRAMWIEVNRDQARMGLFELTTLRNYKFTKMRESLVTLECTAGYKDAAERGYNLIVSDTNLNPGRREALERHLESLGYEVEIKTFIAPLQTLYERDERRSESVGRKVLYRMWKAFQEQYGEPQYVGNDNLPDAVIFDMDGTLADMGKRNPHDESKVIEDTVRDHVRIILYAYQQAGYEIIILSGRHDTCMKDTAQWLINHDIHQDALFMRAADDNRKDSVIKMEIFHEQIKGAWNVKLAVDDRPQMLRAWLELGVELVSVGDPYEEF